MIRDGTALYCASHLGTLLTIVEQQTPTVALAISLEKSSHWGEKSLAWHWEPFHRAAAPSLLRGYSSMSLASSSEKSDIELSDEEERSSWNEIGSNSARFPRPRCYLISLPEGVLCGVLLHILSHFLLIFLRSAMQKHSRIQIIAASKIWLTCEGTSLQHPHSMDRWGLGRSATKILF